MNPSNLISESKLMTSMLCCFKSFIIPVALKTANGNCTKLVIEKKKKKISRIRDKSTLVTESKSYTIHRNIHCVEIKINGTCLMLHVIEILIF